jgi:hypothetical protein
MTNELEKAHRDLNNLEEQREILFSRASKLSKERDQIAFAALTAKDKKAVDRLKEINAEDIGLAGNIASVESALTVARAHLKEAQQGEAIAANQSKAQQIAELKTAFVENGINAGDALADFIGSIMEMKKQRDDMEALGIKTPSSRQFHVNTVIAVKTMLQQLPQPMVNELQDWRLLLSTQRMSFKDITAGWDATITRQITERLGSKEAA